MILKTIIIEFSTKKQRYKKLPRKARPTEKKKRYSLVIVLEFMFNLFILEKLFQEPALKPQPTSVFFVTMSELYRDSSEPFG